ncbi:MAG: LysM peptidoglycan-binding domain-containing protein, partial [Methanomicrobiales archaeon]|nr:LysM peptidoglycan-binding domain-containing protein [Methanomicrobiales archaeon]
RIADIRKWNNLSEAYKIQIGDELIILSPKAKGYVPPPKEGQIELSKPGPDGKVVHTVRPYEYLGKIAEAYGVTVARIAELNGIKVTTPLTIGWDLVIVPSNHTATPTERPLTPIERLTPAADGNYYHIVGEGAALEGIAKLYGISVKDLMAWNNLNENSIIYVGDRLLLNVTPPATITPTFTPVTPSPSATITPTPSNTPIPSATPAQALTETPEVRSVSSANITKILLPVFAGVAVVVAIFLFLQYKRGQKQDT